MLKKIMSGTLASVILFGSMSYNTKAFNILACGSTVELMNAKCKLDDFVPIKEDVVKLINQLYEAELNGIYETRYKSLLNQYRENKDIVDALKNVDLILKDTFGNGIVTFRHESFSEISISSELQEKLIKMNPVLQQTMMRLEVLRCLYVAMDIGSIVTDGHYRSNDFLCSPWLRGNLNGPMVNLNEYNYSKLLGNLLLLYSHKQMSNLAPSDAIKNIESYIKQVNSSANLKRTQGLWGVMDIFKSNSNPNSDSNEILSIKRFGNIEYLKESNIHAFEDLMIKIIDQLENK